MFYKTVFISLLFMYAHNGFVIDIFNKLIKYFVNVSVLISNQTNSDGLKKKHTHTQKEKLLEVLDNLSEYTRVLIPKFETCHHKR